LRDVYIATGIGDGRTLGFAAYGGFFEVESRRIRRSNCSLRMGGECYNKEDDESGGGLGEHLEK
jgi:hypothetical protein